MGGPTDAGSPLAPARDHQAWVLRSHLDLFGEIDRLALVDTKVMGGAVDALVAEHVLAGSQVLGLLVDRGGLGAPHAVGAATPMVELGSAGPFLHEVGVLLAADGIAVVPVAGAGEQKVILGFGGSADPVGQG